MHKAIVAIGTNLGDKKENIKTAIKKMELYGIKVTKQGKLYKTKPYGYTEQPIFLNTAVEVETALSPKELLKALLKIEKEMGRVRKIHWGPRTIDLDIIFFDELVINEENLKVPHPDMQNREFVLKPVCDIEPCWVHPVFCETVKTLLEKLKNAKEAS